MKQSKLIILIFVACTLAACDQINQLTAGSPKKTVATYMDANLQQDWETAYQHHSKKDKAAKPLSTYLKEKEGESQFVRILASKITYEITDSKISGDTATVKANVTMPDIGSMLGELMQSAFSEAFSGKEVDEASIDSKLASKLENNELPMSTDVETFDLVLEDGQWKILDDWATETKVNALIEEAESLKEQKKLRLARDKYNEVLELDSEMVSAKEARDELNEDIDEFEKKQVYIDQVQLYDLTAMYYSTYLDDRVPGVDFKIKNTGDRTLSRVEVTIYFMDAQENVIYEEDYTPVLVSEYSWRDNKPLKPNYVWQQERGKFYKANSVPSEWKEGSVKAKISDIEFHK